MKKAKETEIQKPEKPPKVPKPEKPPKAPKAKSPSAAARAAEKAAKALVKAKEAEKKARLKAKAKEAKARAKAKARAQKPQSAWAKRAAARRDIRLESLPTLEQVFTERRRVRRKYAYIKALRRTVTVLTSVAAVAVLISTLFLPVLQITGNSMMPTLKNDNIVVLVKTTKFKTGDICAFSWNNRTLLKRVIGLPGDWVEVNKETGDVTVNGVVLDEPYLEEKSYGEGKITDIEFPYQVPDNSLFVMGDHRKDSVDSRRSEVGAVHYRYVIGKVAFRIWPLDEIGALT